MLRINVPSNTESNITFSAFEKFELPAPPQGVDAEINDDLVLQFEDEEEAIIYWDQLEDLLNQMDDKTTPQYLAISDIILAIKDDEFVQSYSR
jgi:hypothetical protein